LSRYFKLWCEGFNRGKGAFIYLTPSGEAPNPEGFDDKRYPDYPQKIILKKIRLLSYRHDIKTWLNLVLPQVQADRVRETLKQYIEILSYL